MKGMLALITSLIWRNKDYKCRIIECHSRRKEGVFTKMFGHANMCHNIKGVV
jgi:hypothetical protein